MTGNTCGRYRPHRFPGASMWRPGAVVGHCGRAQERQDHSDTHKEEIAKLHVAHPRKTRRSAHLATSDGSPVPIEREARGAVAAFHNIVILTGAGLSAESGLGTSATKVDGGRKSRSRRWRSLKASPATQCVCTTSTISAGEGIAMRGPMRRIRRWRGSSGIILATCLPSRRI